MVDRAKLNAGLERVLRDLQQELADCPDSEAMKARLDQLRWPYGPWNERDSVSEMVARRLGQHALVRESKKRMEQAIGHKGRR